MHDQTCEHAEGHRPAPTPLGAQAVQARQSRSRPRRRVGRHLPPRANASEGGNGRTMASSFDNCVACLNAYVPAGLYAVAATMQDVERLWCKAG